MIDRSLAQEYSRACRKLDARFFGDHFTLESSNALPRMTLVCYPECS
jgi:hypothetical protein